MRGISSQTHFIFLTQEVARLQVQLAEGSDIGPCAIVHLQRSAVGNLRRLANRQEMSQIVRTDHGSRLSWPLAAQEDQENDPSAAKQCGFT